MKTIKSNFAMYRLCWRWVNVICVVCLMIACGHMCVAKHIAGLHVLNLSVFALFLCMSGMGIMLCLFMMHYAKCPHCGKSVLSKWWNYGRLSKSENARQLFVRIAGRRLKRNEYADDVCAGHSGKKETPTPEPESASETGK